jgi:hypothetical protein
LQDRPFFPSPRDIAKIIGPVEVHTLQIPAHCSHGFLGAYWRRPAEYLKASVRAAISTFSKLDSMAGLARLERDLQDGTWSNRYGSLMALPELETGYRLIVARGA